jgi:hypothetical protein
VLIIAYPKKKANRDFPGRAKGKSITKNVDNVDNVEDKFYIKSL